MKQIVYMSFVLAMLTLAACGRYHDVNNVAGPTGPQGPAGPVAPAPSVTPIQQQINDLVSAENVYRESLGQTELSSGLGCSVQAVSGGQYLSSSSPGYTAAQAIVVTGPSYAYLLKVGFDQPNSGPGPNDVIDPSIQGLFLTNNYKISCSGQLVVTEDGYHAFSMSSDDGSILTIDGTQVINNDGSHGITTVNGTKNLRAGVHTFSLLYAQSGAGPFALILNMDGALLPAANLYH